MFQNIASTRRPLLAVALLGTVFSFASPVFAACDVVGAHTTIECGPDGVNIELTGTTGVVTLDDFILDPSDSEGFVRINASDTTGSRTDVTVNVTGDSRIESLNYDGLDVRTRFGDITVTLDAGTLVDADQTGLYIDSSDTSASSPYRGGDLLVTNYGTVLSGPQTNPMGANGILALANAGGVQVNNYGTVTVRLDTLGVTDGRGIVADGGYWANETVTVGIYNNGTVNALHDGLRINSYNGLGRAVNDVNGMVTSRDRRGVVVWSAKGPAEFENHGTVIALDGPGVDVWSEGSTVGYASLINSGLIMASDDPDQNSTDIYFAGVHIWSEVKGDATLTNRASGQIIATDGAGAFLQSTEGNVAIYNAGLIKGETSAILVTGDDLNEAFGLSGGDAIADYEGAVGGDITVTNDGLLTAFSTQGPSATRALVTLAGTDLGSVTLENRAGGVIGAGLDLSAGFDTGLLGGSATQLAALSGALGNYAAMLAAQADAITVLNSGTILGRITTGTVDDGFGTGPTTGDDGYMANDGLWATTGESHIRGIQNRGTIWTLGETSLFGDITNYTGTMVLSASSTEVAALTLGGDYSGGYAGRLVLNIGAGALVGNAPLVSIAGNASGLTTIELASLDGWDWTNGDPLDVVKVAGNVPQGEASFSMDDVTRGLVHYQLDYAAGDKLWSIDASVSEQSVADTVQIAEVVAGGVFDIGTDTLNRTGDLRNAYWGEGRSEPLGYAATSTTPADDAISSALEVDTAPALRVWSRGRGAAGGGGDYEGTQGSFTFGADIAAEIDDTFVAAGVFGVVSNTALTSDGSNSAVGISGQALGAYATAMWSSGLFVSGSLAAETADIDFELAGETAAFDADLFGVRADVGYRFAVGEVDLEPSVGISYGRTTYGDFELSNVTVSLDEARALAADARLRVSRTFTTENAEFTPYAVLTLGQRSSNDGVITLSDIGAVGALADGGTYGGVTAGLEATSLDGRLAGFAQAEVTASETSLWSAVKFGGAYRF